MATIRPGNRPTLLVVDAQIDVMKNSHQADQVAGKIRTTVDRARAAGVPVVWVRHSADDLPEGSAGWAIRPDLGAQATETVVGKKHNSSFEETNLEQVLAELGTTRLVLCGAQTNWCIRATGYGALERGYDVTLVSDGHTTEDTELGPDRVLKAADVITDLNIAFSWLSYPGRKNEAVTAAEVTF